jgi:circadian clock protein KaiB
MMSAAKPKTFHLAREPGVWDFQLYVVGRSPRCVQAFANLERACEDRIPGRYHIDVIDVLEHPEVARAQQIVAVPTAVRRHPKPVRTMIGALSDTARLLARLDLEKQD